MEKIMNNYLVFDAGGTFIKYALMDENAVILEKDKAPTPGYEDHTLEDFMKVLDVVVEKYRNRISGIAVSMPGMMDSEKGYCITGGMLTYCCELPLMQVMERRYGLPVSVENDGKCAALAERWKGSLRECKNGAVVVLGTGVGGGIVIDGQLYRGSHFTAGEYSFVVTDTAEKDRLDGYWGFNNGSDALAGLVAKYTGENPALLDGFRIFERANAGEESVLKAVKDFTDALAVQVYNLNILLDLDVIAIGGGISQQPLLIQYLKESVDEFEERHPVKKISPYIPKPRITNCTYYNDANLVGALYHYKQLKEGRI